MSAALPGVELEDGLVKVDSETMATTRPGVYAAGDMVNGGSTVVLAVAQGRKAAQAMNVYMARQRPKRSKKK